MTFILDRLRDPFHHQADLAKAQYTAMARLKLRIENDDLLTTAVAAHLGVEPRHIEATADRGLFLKLQMKRAIKAWLDQATEQL